MIKAGIYGFLIIICSCAVEAIAQAPQISSLETYTGTMGDQLVIAGNNFGTDAANLKVFFGSTEATIVSVSDQLLQVEVPAGASYDAVSVTNLANGLTGYSPKPFLLKFGGAHGISASDFSTQTDFDSETGLYDVCSCDFDGDGKNDIATVGTGSNSIAVYRNQSSTGTFSFTKSNILINARTLHVTCGDLNGDGRPDIVASENDGSRIFLFRNTGGMAFSVQALTLTGTKVKQVVVSDIDVDGKPELVVSDQSSGNIRVIRNESTTSSLNFSSSPTVLTIPGASTSDAVEVGDLNGDGLPDLMASQFNTTTDVFIFRNQSSPGMLAFDDPSSLTGGGTIVNLRSGDLDGDGRPDLVATRLLTSDIVVYRNQSSGSAISFAHPVPVAAASRPWGVRMGDLDGDGRIDLVLSSIDPASTALTILNNESTPGSISFATPLSLAVTYINRHPQVLDMDGDGKPDLLFASVDDNNLGITASKASIIRNQSCFVPALMPEGPLDICAGFDQELKSSLGGGVTYEWRRNDVVVPDESESTLVVNTSGDYRVVATSEGGACVESSNTVTINVSTPGSALSGADPNARSNSPACTNGTLTLEVDDVGADTYRWSGPGGFSQDGLTVNRVIQGAEEAGIYTVELRLGSCVADIDTVIVEVLDIPEFTVSFAGSEIFCAGQAKALALTPPPGTGFAVQWHETQSGALTGETDPTVEITASGEYYAVITPTGGCDPVETEAVLLHAATLPVAAFTTSATTPCVGQEVAFNNTSTFDEMLQPVFEWTFGDNTTSQDENPVHAFAQAGTFDVTLTVSYDGGLCTDDFAVEVEVMDAPAVAITNGSNRFALCASDTLHLRVSGGPFESYEWSTGETASFIVVDEPGDYSVTVLTQSGCSIEAMRTITEAPAPVVTASAEPQQINAGETSQLSATGLDSYTWSPGAVLSDSTIANPVATPFQTTVFTVYGEDENGCYGEASVEVIVLGVSPFDRISPRNYFSPNGDDLNNVWVIVDIENFPGCAVSIFNDKGAKVFEAKPYRNDWDGTYKGSELPEGVYYYAIRCDGEATVKTGSITLLK